VNGRAGAWEGLLIPAYMFVGTAIFRAHSGQIRVRKAWLVSIAVLAMVVVTDLYNTTQWNLSPHDEMIQRRRWIIAVLLAAALFGAGLLVRNRKLPRILAWLGQISFSVYLLHPIFILVFVGQLNKFGDTYSNSAPIWQQIGAFVGFVAFIMLCCSVTFKLIEEPMQNLGRAVSRWCDDRFGSDVGLFRSGSAADRAAAASVGVPARAASEQPAP
jgi:peptidoglycan/LPS O-acetylase OafA/YrhL